MATKTTADDKPRCPRCGEAQMSDDDVALGRFNGAVWAAAWRVR